MMAMTLIDQWHFRHEADDLWKRVEEAILNLATVIYAESSGVANHSERLRWANKVFSSEDAPAEMMHAMRNALSQHALIATNGSAATDLNIKNALDATVNTFALQV